MPAAAPVSSLKVVAIVCGVLLVLLLVALLIYSQRKRLERIGHYISEEKNYLFVGLYAALVWGGFGVFVWKFFPHIAPLHRVLSCAATVWPFYHLVRCMWSDPGIVTRDNVNAWLAANPYDNVIHLPNTCAVCQLPRPARAKHCSICGVCVARSDHHCDRLVIAIFLPRSSLTAPSSGPWVNNCVGAFNIRHFVAFLLSTATLCLYCVVLAFFVLQYHYGNTLRAPRWAPPHTDPYRLPTPQKLLMCFADNVLVVCLGLFTAVIAFVLYAFAIYHLSLVCTNVTTYEEFKWDRYHRTGRRAVQLVAREREKAGLPFRMTLKSVDECIEVAASTAEAFSLDVDNDEEVARLLGEKESDKSETPRAKLMRAVLVLEKYDPQASQLYAVGKSWRDNLREAFFPPVLAQLQQPSPLPVIEDDKDS